MRNRSRIPLILGLCVAALSAQTATPTRPTHGKRYARLAIRNAMIVDGNGTPASGPKDIIIENNMITAIVPFDPVASQGGRGKRLPADVEIDAAGKYVLPGLINAHAHTQDERGGIPQPFDYELKIWLACGITTVRDVGSETKKTLELRAQERRRRDRRAPDFLIYPMFNSIQPVPTTPEQARARMREFKAMGADGVKFLGMYREHHGSGGGRGAQTRVCPSLTMLVWRKRPPGTISSSGHAASSTGTEYPMRRFRTTCRISLRTTTTTTKPIVSAMPATCGARRTRTS